MKTVTLTEAEQDLLTGVLTACMSDLRTEISHTDNSTFKEELRRRRTRIDALLKKVGELQAAMG